MARIDLEFEVCTACGLVRQSSFSRPPAYDEVDRATTLQKPAHLGDVLSRLGRAGIRGDDLILEIGANDGAFLEALRSAGFRNLVGVEPSKALSRAACERGFRVITGYFGPEFAVRFVGDFGRARAIICRHTLEHVPQPDAFAHALAECLDPKVGVALVEIPDGAAIPDLLNVYELWDEHLYCFTKGNLRRLLAKAGLRVDSVDAVPHLDTRNLVAWCTIADGRFDDGAADGEDVRRWLALPSAFESYRAAFLAALDAAPRPVYFVGASHSQSNFANYLDIAARVDYMIDDDVSKAGRLAPLRGEGGRIITTAEFLATAARGTVVRTGFGYPGWMNRVCGHAESVGMTVIDPLSCRPS